MPYYRKARRTSKYTGRRSARSTSRRRPAAKRARSSVQTVRLVIEQRPPVTDADLPIGMRQQSLPKRARF